MRKNYHLSEADIKEAIRAYIRAQDGEDTSALCDVMLMITPGDRPGEGASISAMASPSQPRGIDPFD